MAESDAAGAAGPRPGVHGGIAAEDAQPVPWHLCKLDNGDPCVAVFDRDMLEQFRSTFAARKGVERKNALLVILHGIVHLPSPAKTKWPIDYRFYGVRIAIARSTSSTR